MATKYHQNALSDLFSDCQNILIDDTPSFFALLSDHIDLDEFIPHEFFSAFYCSLGRNRVYPLAWFSYCLYPAENLFHSFCFPASAVFTFM